MVETPCIKPGSPGTRISSSPYMLQFPYKEFGPSAGKVDLQGLGIDLAQADAHVKSRHSGTYAPWG